MKLRYHNQGAKIHYLFEIIHILLIKKYKKATLSLFYGFLFDTKKEYKSMVFRENNRTFAFRN